MDKDNTEGRGERGAGSLKEAIGNARLEAERRAKNGVGGAKNTVRNAIKK